MADISIALQLFSVKKEMEKDLANTLKRVAEIGYDYVELPVKNEGENGAFIPSIPLEELQGLLKEHGLEVMASHIGYEPNLNLGQVAAYNLGLGSERVIIPAHFFSTKQDAYDFAAWLNQAGATLKQHGLELYYHNHYHEFQELDGEVVMDILLDQTDPALVHFEFDTFWAVRAGIDPVSYLDRLGERCKLIHQKDLHEEANPVNLLAKVTGELTSEATFSPVAESDFVEIGAGILDIAGIIGKVKEMGHIPYIVVEQDRTTKGEFASVEESYQALQKLLEN